MRVAAIVLLLVGLLWSVLVVWIFLTIASIAAFESLARVALIWTGAERSSMIFSMLLLASIFLQSAFPRLHLPTPQNNVVVSSSRFSSTHKIHQQGSDSAAKRSNRETMPFP
jgi:hypothetical protein